MRVPFIHPKENRYQTQERTANIGKSGQRRLSKSRIAIVGLGALGSLAAEILTRAGTGRIHLIDRDIVELSNLHRQHCYSEEDIGKAKADILRTRLSKMNSEIRITASITDLTSSNIDTELKRNDLILDCTDNKATRFLLNDFCRRRKIPWVSASAAGTIGSIILFKHDKTSPCFRCIFDDKTDDLTCDTAGIMPTVTAIVSSMQADIALNYLLHNHPDGKMIRTQSSSLTTEHLTITQREDCPLCSQKRFDYLTAKEPSTVKLCGSTCYQITGKPINLSKLKAKLEKTGKVDDLTYAVRFNDLTFFSDGRVLVRTDNKEEAAIKYDKYIK